MTAVYIVAGVLLLIGILVLLPISVFFKFDGGIEFSVRYMRFIKIFSYPKSPEKKEAEIEDEDEDENAEDTPQKKKKNFLAEDFERLGVRNFIKAYTPAAKELIKRLFWFLKRIKFKIFILDLTVATDDACDTAVEYGKICSLLYPVLSVIRENTNTKMKRININADFNKTSYDFMTEISASVKPVFAIIALIKIYGIYKSLKNGKFTSEEGEDKK